METIYSTRSKPCARIERWVLRLQPYQFKVNYLPGKQNIADPLSRLLQTEEQAEPSPEQRVAEEFTRFVAVTTTPQAMTTQEIEVKTPSVPEPVRRSQRKRVLPRRFEDYTMP